MIVFVERRLMDFRKLEKYLYVVLIVSFLGTLISACVNKKEQYVKQWYGKTIQFPDSMTFKRHARDKCFFDYRGGRYKVLILLGNVECISCRLKIDDWQRFIQDVDTTVLGVNYIFIMNPVYQRELYTILKLHEFSIPVCVDNNEDIRLLNNMPLNTSHVFLLDQQNRIICVGNPITNRHIRELYKKYSQLYTLMHQSHKNKSRTQIQT